MSIYVFAGPTISHSEVSEMLPDAICLPPAAQGDVYRMAQRRPAVIAIIDGYFDWVPAVWHKEVLWAMAASTHIFGSASMGALRAAELAAFGMVGVGRIFEQFRDGELEDDDEVAVVHGPADAGYRALSDAMVNIRATLAAARLQGVISAASHDELIATAKSLHYPQRTYGEALERAAPHILPDELAAFRAWLPRGRIDQKREDAKEMLAVIARRSADGLEPKSVDYALAYTEVWHRVTQSAGFASEARGAEPTATFGDAMLDELRLDAAMFAQTVRAAFTRLLAVSFARQHGVNGDADMLTTAERFRRERNLLKEADLEHWLQRCHLGRESFLRLMRDEAMLSWAEEAVAPAVSGYLLDQARVSDQYQALAERAQDKNRVLARGGIGHLSLSDLGADVDERVLMRWFVQEKLGGELDLSLDAYASAVGYTAPEDFLAALVREYRYSQVNVDEP